jgi:predicted DNA-binding protein
MTNERDEESLPINIDDRDFRRTPLFRREFAAYIKEKMMEHNISTVEEFAMVVNALKPLSSGEKGKDSEKSCKRYLVDWENTQSTISKDNMLLYLQAAESSPQEFIDYLLQKQNKTQERQHKEIHAKDRAVVDVHNSNIFPGDIHNSVINIHSNKNEDERPK